MLTTAPPASSYDSDTESETETRIEDCILHNSSEDFVNRLQTSSRNPPNVAEVTEAVQAVELLASMRLQDANDHPLHEAVHHAASTMLGFLDGVTSHQDDFLSEIHQHLFSQMLKPSFISRLFEHRRVLHSLIAESSQSIHESVVVIWVDVLIARIGEAIFLIGGRGSFVHTLSGCDARETNLLSFMNSQTQKDQSIRVASQLPATWECTMEILNSETISEAARRLALSLAFGAYVLRDDLDAEPDQASHQNGTELLEDALRAYVTRISRENLGGFAISDRFHTDAIRESQYAMVISLIAKFEASPMRNTSRCKLTYRPSMLDTVIDLVEIIMAEFLGSGLGYSDKPSFLLENVNQTQTRLLAWGATLPWCWMLWGSEGGLRRQNIVALTAIWLFHFALDESAINKVLHYSPVAAMTVLLQLITPSSSNNLPENAVLYKACWAVFCLAQQYPRDVGDQLLMETCLRFFLLIPSCQHTNIGASTYQIAMELIISLNPDLIKTALQCDRRSSISVIVNEVLENLSRLFTSLANEEDARRLGVLLDFLIILVYSDAPEASCLVRNRSFVTQISRMLRQDSLWPEASITQIVLLLGFLGCIDRTLTGLEDNPDDVYRSAVAQGPKDFIMAAAFAFYVHSTVKSSSIDPSVRVEAWGYLRDVLLLMLKNERDSEELILLLPASICSALSRLFEDMQPNAVRMSLNSPWTMSLYHELRKAVGISAECQSKSSLAFVARALLDQIDAALKTTERLVFRSSSPISISARLIVHRSYKDIQLVAITVD